MCARHIEFAYHRGARPLVDASIDIPAASRVAILGANGSGKTTLLRVLAGSLKPVRGTVEVGGVELRHNRSGLRAHRQAVQLVLQNPDDQLFSADVAHDVAFGPVNLGLDRTQVGERVAESLQLLSIEALAARPTHELSYGERKRVAMAGAMAMRPCVLLLDEPTAGLDPAGVDEMFRALDRLEEHGTTVVLSTHDTTMALEWSNSVAVVSGGRVRQGEPHRLLSDADLMSAARLRPPWLIQLIDCLSAEGIEIPSQDGLQGVEDLAKQIVALLGPHRGRRPQGVHSTRVG